MIPNFHFDPALVDDIASDFDLRGPNRQALRVLVERLSGDFDSAVPQVMDMATGAGKTYLMASFIEYIRRVTGRAEVMVVTPGLVVQNKTIANFSEGHPKYILGAGLPPKVITPDNYITEIQQSFHDQDLGGQRRAEVHVFNIQQLIAPPTLEGSTTEGKDAARRGIRKHNEFAGVLYDQLAANDNLVAIADEHHLYGPSAKAFNAAIRDLKPAAVIGLTATSDARDEVIYRYPLHQAIKDQHVKIPVIAYRKGGYGELGEHQQLRDALTLLKGKKQAYATYISENPGIPAVYPLLFVVCADIAHATEVSEKLRTPEFFGSSTAVLQVTSDSMTPDVERTLANLDRPDSLVRAVVSVNKLKEGWDVKNIAVMVTLRAMDSQVLTQQTMGRGLRLPFGYWVDDAAINELDIVAHESFRKLLEAENVLRSFGLLDAVPDTEERTKVVRADDSDGASGGGNGQVATEIEDGVSTGTSGAAKVTEDDADSATEVKIGGREGVRAKQIGGDGPGDIPTPPPPPARVRVQVRDHLAGRTFTFPRSTLRRVDAAFELDDITDDEVETAAKSITSEGGRMERVALDPNVVAGKILTRSRVQAEVEALLTSREHVEAELLHQLFSLNGITQTSENITYARGHLIPRLLDAAPIGDWSVKALASAVTVLADLIARKTTEYRNKLAVTVHLDPLELPVDDGYYLSSGQTIKDRALVNTRASFAARQHYGQWNSSMFTAESFDSYSGEFMLAELLDTSPHIRWWKRLYEHEKAYMAYSLDRRYFPDFAAEDSDGRIWIIEGKSDAGRDDGVVQLKRSAAEKTIRRLRTQEQFIGKSYGYLIGYESDIASSDSWSDLRAKASPVVT
ncbi:MAG: DEAD/DEAH box helicase family protein [Dietzia psychralcaliphila]